MSTILFLDIDGVLAVRPASAFRPSPHPATPRRGHHHLHHQPQRPKPPRILQADAIARLNDLSCRTRAQLVVSSSWRPQLAAAGVAGPFHPDWRTDEDGPTRGEEITRWLRAHEVSRYVVLDDWRQGVEDHADRLVCPDYRVGLREGDVTMALTLLWAA
ncbi:HAD domain-containing protein [Roseomonas sp. NAR14]|uniref:HAD domain-containing protein n=1 Tax=Roseomonas acroporae TaxID=2937791 RepID=A0A9X1Y617_9PROT|nr:HAD domain-containing protein [Roseomonas acroporae]MCK8784128.1 HAD domain-containing protein [Roseomonas acroporae]